MNLSNVTNLIIIVFDFKWKSLGVLGVSENDLSDVVSSGAVPSVGVGVL